MAIPESQLETWANIGAIQTSATAYQRIQAALRASDSPLAGRALDVFLQGSYANATNIRGDSDIDVVVLYDDTYYKDLTRLSELERAAYAASQIPATYHWHQLRDDVVIALAMHFGSNAVTRGDKAITVKTGVGTMEADIVPAVQFRRYATFAAQKDFTAHFGIQFFDSSDNAIVNYPKYHIERGTAKNAQQRTSGCYKPTVRLFKNFRNHLIDNRLLSSNVAPSYFLECMLYNVPDGLFGGRYSDSVPKILNHLGAATSETLQAFICQNGVVPLFGNGSTQWSVQSMNTFLQAAATRWNGW